MKALADGRLRGGSAPTPIPHASSLTVCEPGRGTRAEIPGSRLLVPCPLCRRPHGRKFSCSARRESSPPSNTGERARGAAAARSHSHMHAFAAPQQRRDYPGGMCVQSHHTTQLLHRHEAAAWPVQGVSGFCCGLWNVVAACVQAEQAAGFGGCRAHALLRHARSPARGAMPVATCTRCMRGPAAPACACPASTSTLSGTALLPPLPPSTRHLLEACHLVLGNFLSLLYSLQVGGRVDGLVGGGDRCLEGLQSGPTGLLPGG